MRRKNTSLLEGKVAVSNIQKISMTKTGKAVLINDEDKETEGPQLWEINLDENRISVRISRGHTYKWKTAIVASVASFWGMDDEFVICADLKTSKIHIWNTKTAEHIFGIEGFGPSSCIAWLPSSSALSGFVFTTGSRDGAVKLWKASFGSALGHLPVEPKGLVGRTESLFRINRT